MRKDVCSSIALISVPSARSANSLLAGEIISDEIQQELMARLPEALNENGYVIRDCLCFISCDKYTFEWEVSEEMIKESRVELQDLHEQLKEIESELPRDEKEHEEEHQSIENAP